MLAKPVMQFLAQSLLFPVADREDFSFQSLSMLDFTFQFGVCDSQRPGTFLDEFFEQVLGSLQRDFGVFPVSNVGVRLQNMTSPSEFIAIKCPMTHDNNFFTVLACVNELPGPATVALELRVNLLERFGMIR